MLNSDLRAIFSGYRADLEAESNAKNSAESALRALQQQLVGAQQQMNGLMAEGRPVDDEELLLATAQVSQLQDQITIKQDEVTTRQASLGSIQFNMAGLGSQDDLVEEMEDSVPVLLFPLRVETRFMIVKHVKRLSPGSGGENTGVGTHPDRKELWVRAFPDDIMVNTHERALTPLENDQAATYWSEISAAAGDADKELGAWRALVAGNGPERAAYIRMLTNPNGPMNLYTLKSGSWTQAPQIKTLPDRLVVRLYDGNTYREVVGNTIPSEVKIGLDPNSLDSEYDQSNGGLELPAALRWMYDFEAAVEVGMAVRIVLDGNEATTGFSKIVVAGVKYSATAAHSQFLLEELINGHHYTDGGFALLPQGTPTNNTEDEKSGFKEVDLSVSDSFRIETGTPLFTVEADEEDKSDGQHLAEILGISYSTLQHIAHADGTDIKEGMAMNKALWPATMGYFLSQMMFPTVSEDEQDHIRDFFQAHVLGRGKIPAIRRGNQPYGILPSTNWQNWGGTGVAPSDMTLSKLYTQVLSRMETTWTSLANGVSHAGQSGESNETLLDILGLHGSSGEYYQRFTAGIYLLWNIFNYAQHELPVNSPAKTLDMSGFLAEKDFEALFGANGLGYDLSDAVPRIFDMVFMDDAKFLNGPVIDKLKASWTRQIKAIAGTDRNYIAWLVDSSMDDVIAEDFIWTLLPTNSGNGEGGGGTGGAQNVEPVNPNPPQALLYLLLRQSCLLEWVKTGIQILQQGSEVSEEANLDLELNSIQAPNASGGEIETLVSRQVNAQLTYEHLLGIEEQIVIQLGENAPPEEQDALRVTLLSEGQATLQSNISLEINSRMSNLQSSDNKWSYLSESYSGITQVDQSLSEFIAAELGNSSATVSRISELKGALNSLKTVPTARLERCFAETLDVCNYRLDAWYTGLLDKHLRQLRTDENNRRTGIYLGAFGYLEEVSPGPFLGIHVEEVGSDPEGGGEGGGEGGSGEGEGGGESAPDIRNLFDLPEPPSLQYLGTGVVDNIVFDHTQDKFTAAAREDVSNQGYIHAPSQNHAVAGAVLRSGFLAHKDQAGSPDDALAVNLISTRVRKALFYIEGIRNGQELAALLGYQFERGLYDNLSVNPDAYILEMRSVFPLVAGRVTANAGSDPGGQESQNVVDGMALVETYQKNPTTWASGVWSSPPAELAEIEAEIQKLMDAIDAIGDLLTAESVFQVTQGNFDRTTATLNSLTEGKFPEVPEIIQTPRPGHILTHRVGLQFNVQAATATAWSLPATPMAQTEDKVNAWLAEHLPPANKIRFHYAYTYFDTNTQQVQVANTVGDLTLLNLQPINLLGLLNWVEAEGSNAELLQRIAYEVKRSQAQRDDESVSINFMDRTGFGADEFTVFEIVPLASRLATLLQSARPLQGDDFLLPGQADEVVENAGAGTGWDLTSITAKVTAAVGPSLPGNMGLADAQTALDNAIAAANNLDFNALPANPETILNGLRSAMMDAAQFDLAGAIPAIAFEFSESARDQLVAQASKMSSQAQGKANRATSLLTALATLNTDREKMAQLQEIAEVLFGTSFRLVPEFNFYNSVEVDAAHNRPGLLDEAGEFAMEEWTQGVARVRPRMKGAHIGGMVLRSMLDDDTLLQFSPMQFPLDPNQGDRWLGMQVPDGYEVAGDTLSMVLSYQSGWSSNNLQAGLLIDEWTEEIPEELITSSLAVHFNRPNSEAANALILAVTPRETGTWSWNDIVGSVTQAMDWAKKRAVEPDQLKTTPYAQVLPAIMAPINSRGNTVGVDFGKNTVVIPPGLVGPIKTDTFNGNDPGGS